MLVARLFKVLVPLFFTGILMLIAVRFARGVDDGTAKEGWLHSNAMWATLGKILVGFGVYFFLTRFFR